MKYYIKEREWEEILAVLRKIKDIHTGNEHSLRCFVEAIWYIARSGCQWRLLPEHYGHFRTVHARFKYWSNKGIWNQLFNQTIKDPDKELFMIDATIVRAHPCSAGYKKNSCESLGRSKGGFTTKIHALTDGLGLPLKFSLTAGNRNDITQAENLTADVSDAMVAADKGYDSDKLVENLSTKGCIPVIPSRKGRKFPREYDEHIYKERHLIECFFGKIKHFRRIFSRFDKTASAFMGFLTFVAVFIWLR